MVSRCKQMSVLSGWCAQVSQKNSAYFYFYFILFLDFNIWFAHVNITSLCADMFQWKRDVTDVLSQFQYGYKICVIYLFLA